MRASVDNNISTLGDRVVAVVRRLIDGPHGGRAFNSEAALADFGLTSLDAVRLVLLVEDEFDLMIPLSKITPANFRSISTISRLIHELLSGAQQAV
jgi:acyl carrier protein